MHLSNKFVEQDIAQKPVGVNYGCSTIRAAPVKVSQTLVTATRPLGNSIPQRYTSEQFTSIPSTKNTLLRSKVIE